MQKHGLDVPDLRGWCLVLLALSGVLGCRPADEGAGGTADPAAWYDGRNIRWIIPYSPGGGYDEYARLVAPYLEKYTGARIDILNVPGAGGMRGANELFNSPRDGLTIGMINGSALVTSEIAEISGADYELAEFEYLGRVVADRRVLVVSNDSGYETFEELLEAGSSARIGATGLGGSTYVDAVIINEAFHGETEIIHGFDSSSIIRQSMLRGNIAGSWGSWGSALEAVDLGRHKVILQSGRERLPELSGVPTAFELAANTPDPRRTRAILAAWETLQAVGRPIAVPPGTPPERVQILREALRKALHDPELLAIAEKTRRMITYASGDEMRQIIGEATNMQADIRPLFVKAIRGEL